MPRKFSDEKIKEIIYKEVPRLIKENPEIREFLWRFLEGCPYKPIVESRFDKLLEEIKAMRLESEKKWEEWKKEMSQMREESEKRWEENRREIARMREESEKRWEEWKREMAQMREESEKRWEESRREMAQMKEESERKWQEILRKIDIRFGALGARWGIQTETAFRNAIKGILEESFPVKVERYLAKDEEGKVFGRPDQIELDLIIKDGETIVAEIKSSMSRADVYIFDKKVKFYEEKEGKKVDRKIIISPMVDPKAQEVASKLGIEVYSYPEYIQEL